MPAHMKRVSAPVTPGSGPFCPAHGRSIPRQKRFCHAFRKRREKKSACARKRWSVRKLRGGLRGKGPKASASEPPGKEISEKAGRAGAATLRMRTIRMREKRHLSAMRGQQQKEVSARRKRGRLCGACCPCGSIRAGKKLRKRSVRLQAWKYPCTRKRPLLSAWRFPTVRKLLRSRLRKKTKKCDKEDWKGTAAKRREAGRSVPGKSYAIFQSRMRTSTLAAPLYMSMAGL